jgi:hypothetical protein
MKYFGIDITLNSSYGYAQKYKAYVNNHFVYSNTIKEIKSFIKKLLKK